MRILFVASEVAPFARAGRLGDVTSALPSALARRGHDVRIVMPAYDLVRQNGFEPRPADPPLIGFDLGGRGVAADIRHLDLGPVPVSLVDVPRLYRRGTIYGEAADEGFRFAVLCRAALELCLRWQWSPDVVHCHDWSAALVPFYLRTWFAEASLLADTRSVLSVRDPTRQGRFPTRAVPELGLEPFQDLLHSGHLEEGWVGVLEAGLTHADAITALGATHAEELLSSEPGSGLEGVLRSRSRHLVGLPEGIDTDVWNPALDRHLPHRYSARSLWRRGWNKRALADDLGLDPAAPMIGLFLPSEAPTASSLVAARIVERTPAQVVMLTPTEYSTEAEARTRQERFRGRIAIWSGSDDARDHRILGSVDLALVPSPNQPGGHLPMASLAYGVPPVVSHHGGAADVVEPWDPATTTGNGFIFDASDPMGAPRAVAEAVAAMEDPKAWKRLQLNGMGADQSWGRSAAGYERLYRSLAETERSSRPANSAT